MKLDSATEKKMLRQVLREVHPDRFDALHPQNSAHNSRSLKILNSFVDGVSLGRFQETARVSFWVHGSAGLELVEAVLPASGSLKPLLAAFGLIPSTDVEEEWDRDFLEWMQSTVREAVERADKYESLKAKIQVKVDHLQEKYELMSLLPVAEFGGGLGVEELQKQLDSVGELEEALAELSEATLAKLAGLRVQVYDETLSGESVKASSVCEDGSLNIVTGQSLRAELAVLDLRRAQVLSRLGNFWRQRVEDLTGELNELLRVEGVVGDHSWAQGDTMGAQRFVLFGGRILEQRDAFEWALKGRHFMYTMLVHGDTSAPYVDYMESTSILQVRSDCPPGRLLEFMMSERGAAVEDAVNASIDARNELEGLLEEVRKAFGARYVISVCPNEMDEEVLGAAARLLENSERVRAAVNLTGASLCFDTCYDAWENGFISFPHDFVLGELEANLRGLLAQAEGSGEGGGLGGEGRAEQGPSSPRPTAAAAAAAALGGGAAAGSRAAAGGRGAPPARAPWWTSLGGRAAAARSSLAHSQAPSRASAGPRRATKAVAGAAAATRLVFA